MSAARRLSELLSQCDSSKRNPAATAPKLKDASASGNNNDVVIACALRTPIGKAKRGSFKDTSLDDLLATVLRAVLDKTGLPAEKVEDITVGNVLGEQSALVARFGQFFAGVPSSVPLNVVNRQCSSGLQAVVNVAAAISAGYINIGIGAGAESMSSKSLSDAGISSINPKVFENTEAQQCLIPMGITSENVASRYGITREMQDTMAVASHRNAFAAQEKGLFRDEIVPTQATMKDEDGNVIGTKIVDKDDGIRPKTTMEILGKLRTSFKKDGTTTPGNSSQVSDGAAAVLLASRAAAKEMNLPILATIKAYSVVGVPPDVMGIGPAVAIPAVLKQAGLTIDDIGVFEINEAFASQAVYCVQKLGIPIEKVNPKGGAIALGHPLGDTGARQIATLLPEMKRRGCRYGIVSMCIGTGMGAACVIEDQ